MVQFSSVESWQLEKVCHDLCVLCLGHVGQVVDSAKRRTFVKLTMRGCSRVLRSIKRCRLEMCFASARVSWSLLLLLVLSTHWQSSIVKVQSVCVCLCVCVCALHSWNLQGAPIKQSLQYLSACRVWTPASRTTDSIIHYRCIWLIVVLFLDWFWCVCAPTDFNALVRRLGCSKQQWSMNAKSLLTEIHRWWRWCLINYFIMTLWCSLAIVVFYVNNACPISGNRCSCILAYTCIPRNTLSSTHAYADNQTYSSRHIILYTCVSSNISGNFKYRGCKLYYLTLVSFTF